MAESPMRVEDIIVPPPAIFRISDKELRLAPLPAKRLLEVVRYVETTKDLPDVLAAAFKADGEGKRKALADLLQTDVLPRLNGLLRLLFWQQEKELTDDWCFDHLSLAHYVTFCRMALVQNQLHDVFQVAKGVAGQFIMATLRSRMPQKVD